MFGRLGRISTGALALCATALVLAGAATGGRAQTQIDWTPVGNAIGVQGKLQPDGVYRVGLPRSDLHVKLEDVTLKPSFALGSYLAFMATSGPNAVMMGDLVVTEKEIQKVMLKLAQGGIEVTAIHNHLIGEKPKVWYMHVMGSGDAVQLATSARAALALSKTPLKAPKTNPKDEKVALDTAALDAAIGATGKVDGGVWKYSIALKFALQMNGMTIPGSMGTGTALNFQPLGKSKAAITGDFAMLAAQVNPVLRALRSHGIAVTALHSHMLDSQPTVFFMHFFAKGNALTLAQGLRAGLNAIG